MNREWLLAVAGPEAVGTGIAASYDHHPLAGRKNLNPWVERVAVASLVLLREEFHRIVNPLQLASGNFQITWMLGAARQDDGIEFTTQIFDGDVVAHFCIGYKLEALGGHLLKAAIDDVLLQFELGNAIAQQSTDAIGFFVNHNRVPGATQLLRRSQSCRSRTDDRYFLSGANLRRLGSNPTLQKSALHNIFFVLLDRDWRLVDTQHTRGFTGSGANSAGKLGEIIGSVQLADGFLPASAIHQIVPVRNEIADGTSGLAEWNAAIHAASALLAQLFLWKILIDFKPIVDPLGDWPAWSQFPRVVHEAGRLTHVAPAQAASARCSLEQERADLECRLARCGRLPALA